VYVTDPGPEGNTRGLGTFLTLMRGGTGVNDDDGAGTGGAGGDGGTAHVALVTMLPSSVTAPLRANTLPSTLAPVLSVADVNAKIFPLKVDDVPSVAELPTCQKTFSARASFIRITLLAEAVVRVVVILKMKILDAVSFVYLHHFRKKIFGASKRWKIFIR